MPSINDIRWSELSHAYGFAGDIPPLLEELYRFPPERDPAAEPWHTLWSSLCHQGDVYSASFAAVPFIVDALASRPSIASTSYFHLPACIELARISHHADVPDHIASSYFGALSRIPMIAAEAWTNDWGPDMAASALAAMSVAKGQCGIARLLVEIDPDDIPEVLEWYFKR